MAIVKKSFISNLIGRSTYDWLKHNAKIIVSIGTSVLALLWGLTFICHFSVVSSMLYLVSGTSLLFIIYIAAIIIVLDCEVDIEEPDNYIWGKPKKHPKTKEYKLTIVWGMVLILLGATAIFFSDKYRKHYAFECDTFLVDNQSSIYHLDIDNDCEEAAKSNNLEKMQGFQIDKTYTFCEWCKEWAEDAEFDAEHDHSNI